MIVETIAILAMLLGGSLLARIAGVRGWPLPAVGFTVGVAVLVAVSALVALVPLSTPLWLPLALTVALPGAWWTARGWRGEPAPLAPVAALGVTAAVVGLVAVFRTANLVNVTPDTFRYLTSAGLLSSGRLEDASAFLLESRALTVPAMHAPAGLQDELYLRSVTPLLAIACALVLAWLIRRGLPDGAPIPPTPATVALLGTALLVSNNRFLFHAFYLNGHLALAVWLLLVGGVTWLLLSGAAAGNEGLHPRGLVLLQSAVVPAMVLTRPEASLLVGLALLPMLLSRDLPKTLRWTPFAMLGVTMAGWQGFLAMAYRAETDAPSTSVDAMFGLGLLVLVVAVVVRVAGTRWVPRRTLGLVEISLWLALVVAIVDDRSIFTASVFETARNVSWAGGWGVSLLVLAIIATVVLLLTSSPGRVAMRFPLTAFIPFAFLLAYLRGHAYRLGLGDSLNRMLLQLLPLAVLFIASAFASRRWGLPWPLGRDAARPTPTEG